MRARLTVATIVAATLVALASTTVLASPGQALADGSVRAASCTETPFSSGFDAEVRRRWPGRRISAAVYDTRTGCQYRYRSDLRITTASVLKIEIMAAVLRRAQREGRGLTATERSRIAPMIRTSNDPAANALWSSVGGTSGLGALDRELGLADTRQASPWGLTTTSAADRNALLRQLVLGQWGPFTASTRATARSFLLDVTPSQRWGLTAGVPSSWKVPLKNGFFDSRCCGWRVNTSGVVERPGGGAYVATVLSDGWSAQAPGVQAVEFVAKVIASWNLASIGPHSSAARFAQQAHRDIVGRSASFGEEQASAWRVGTDPGRAGIELDGLLGSSSVDGTSGSVLRLYRGVLRRDPSPGTWSGRVAQLRNGTRSLDQVADSIAWSSELSGGTPLSTTAFVDLAYQRVYGRLPGSADRAWWVSRIDRGASRGSLLVGLTSSATYRWYASPGVRVAGAYLALLRRLPTGPERSAAEAALIAGQPLAARAGSIFASADYRARFS